jgi:hemerythrin superfamily protein
MKVWDLLARDHREVADLFKRLGETREAGRKAEIFGNLRVALEAHSLLEETHFYPVLKDYDHTRTLAARALTEHRAIQSLLDEIALLSPDELAWTEQCRALEESVADHVAEEEKLLFPLAEEVLDTATIARISQAIESEKEAARAV